MIIKALRPIFFCIVAAVTCSAYADKEHDLIATLQSKANTSKKCNACAELRTVGTTNSLPVLKSLLATKETSQAALYALDGMPFPQALTVIRESVNTAPDYIKSELVDVLGWKHDTAAVAIIIPLVSDTNPTIASAAATALGRIGGKEVAMTLTSAAPGAPDAVKPALYDGLLLCAEGARKAGDSSSAMDVYRRILGWKTSDEVRVAAWRGLVLSDKTKRSKLMLAALMGQDMAVQIAAFQVLRETADREVIKACMAKWSALPIRGQVAVLNADVRRGKEALPAVHLAMQSASPLVRASAWNAVAELGDDSAIKDLARAAATGDSDERDAARRALVLISGPKVPGEFKKCVAKSEPPEKVELLRALGKRDDKQAVEVLLPYADSKDQSVRLAALAALREIAVPGTVRPLMELSARAKSDAESGPLVETLLAVCQASTDKEKTTGEVIEGMDKLPAAAQVRILAVLPALATPAALNAALTTARAEPPASAKEAIKALGQWPTSAPVPGLLELSKNCGDATLRILAVRSCIAVAAQEPDASKRLSMLQQTLSVAQRPDEKKQALSQIGQIASADALSIAMAEVSDSTLETEAGLAALAIAQEVGGTNSALVRETASKLLAQCKSDEVIKRASAIRDQTTKVAPSANQSH